MSDQPTSPERLDSWKDIAIYLNRNVRTVMRWELGKGLPVHRVPGGQRHAVYAWRREIDEWLKNGHLDVEAGRSRSVASEIEAATDGARSRTADAARLLPAAPQIAKRPGFWTKRFAWTLAGILMLIPTGLTIRWFFSPPQVDFTGAIQLTNDGFPKEGLVTDGSYLYFGEDLGGKIVLAYTSIHGGPIDTIPTPFTKAVPQDVSSDRKRLLVLVREGDEDERSLWVVPIDGSPQRPVGKVRCHDAIWSPDGRVIAFAAKNAIYLTNDEGASVHPVQTFESVPHLLRWSRDGKRLRFDLRNPKDFSSSLWEVKLDDHPTSEVESLTPLHISPGKAVAMTVDDADISFIATTNHRGGEIFLVTKARRFWSSRFVQIPMMREISEPQSLVRDPGSDTLFSLGGSGVPSAIKDPSKIELLRLNVHTQEFRPFLPGISAQEVDFSRDGKRISYVKEPEHTLWISRADGNDARQIPFADSDLELPRWSPDGRFIAFMARLEERPWRIFIVSDDGKPKEASNGIDNQGAPTWSPDGQWIVYGNVQCQQTESCAIHKIKISTGQEFLVPGSEGLETARWSPDGRFIAALSPNKHEVMVYEVATQEWRQIAKGFNGNDLSWSADSHSVYAVSPTASRPEIIRIPIDGGQPESIANLAPLARMNGTIGPWFGLAADGSIILSRAINSTELYALKFHEE